MTHGALVLAWRATSASEIAVEIRENARAARRFSELREKLRLGKCQTYIYIHIYMYTTWSRRDYVCVYVRTTNMRIYRAAWQACPCKRGVFDTILESVYRIKFKTENAIFPVIFTYALNISILRANRILSRLLKKYGDEIFSVIIDIF